MAKYQVRLPITGFIDIEVDADNETEAREKAREAATMSDIMEWEFKEKCRGNVCAFPAFYREDIIEVSQ